MSKRNLTELKNFLEEYLELKGINTKKFLLLVKYVNVLLVEQSTIFLNL